jgi:hypothetical protein
MNNVSSGDASKLKGSECNRLITTIELRLSNYSIAMNRLNERVSPVEKRTSLRKFEVGFVCR